MRQLSEKGNVEETSNVARHCWSKDHRMNWNDMRIVGTEPYMMSRKIKETLYSIKEGEGNYFNDISYHLSQIWFPDIDNNS